MGRPEHISPPEIFYSESESQKYTQNTHIIKLQRELSYRALELLALEGDGHIILDIGVGSGLCANIIEESSNYWIGMDISKSMIDVGMERYEQGELTHNNFILADVGHGITFAPGFFDAVISVSVLQWLCNADTSYNDPHRRLKRLFTSLYSSVALGAKAIFQFYPENAAQIDMILNSALQSGFNGGMLIDYPHSTRKKKYYLCLVAGPTITWSPPKDDTYKKPAKGTKQWILHKKEVMRRKGMVVPVDTKYTARKRKPRF